MAIGASGVTYGYRVEESNIWPMAIGAMGYYTAIGARRVTNGHRGLGWGVPYSNRDWAIKTIEVKDVFLLN